LEITDIIKLSTEKKCLEYKGDESENDVLAD